MIAAMDMDDDACYRAIATRDSRFDGKLFVAVTSTGIYCRPICPAPTPKRAHVRFFPTAPAAQAAGFRPCLRCRPESSPDLGAWRGTSATVSRALGLIEAGALDEGGVETLAERLGIGARQLRRLFCQHVGATPVAVAQTRRVLLAKQLLHETSLPMTAIALAAGFGSVRRFNEIFRSLYARPPARLRRGSPAPTPSSEPSARSPSAAGAGTPGTPSGRAPGTPSAGAPSTHGAGTPSAAGAGAIRLRLAYRPPYDWDAILAFLRARAIPGVEVVHQNRYARTIRAGGSSGEVVVEPAAGAHLQATVRCADLKALPAIIARVRRVFDLAADPVAIGAHLGLDAKLAPLVAARPGLRVPGAWDGFELAIRAVLGQQISVAAATRLAGMLVAAHGAPVTDPATRDLGLTHIFPSPAQLAGADLAMLGMPGNRRAALSALAAATVADPQLFSPRQDLQTAIAQLRALPGIGEWTAQYIAMRELREPDAFPAADIGLLRAMSEDGVRPSPAALLARAEPWRPWRAYAALHLWTSEQPAAQAAEQPAAKAAEQPAAAAAEQSALAAAGGSNAGGSNERRAA